ncbi:hypothetical protein [Rhodococcus sp. NPDC058521]|uniref:hypothetical protein n=1 Tax=Rhodococcus sp. NPDC058521 TaxID=3346536 RepID=UPI00364C53AF
MRGIFGKLKQHGLIAPLATIGLCLIAIVVLLYGITWVTNKGSSLGGEARAEGESAATTSGWTAPTLNPQTSTPAPLPEGFPSLRRPPAMVESPEGQPQPVPTKFGLTYTVPGGGDWRPSASRVLGWTDGNGNDIATYGSVSDYKYNFCPERNGSTLADVGITGRNGTDIGTAAKEAIEKAEDIFAEESNGKVSVEISGPFDLEVSGSPAVRYTAKVTEIEPQTSCDVREAGFDVVSTRGYATAEVATLFVKHGDGAPGALTDDDVNNIVGSLQRAE